MSNNKNRNNRKRNNNNGGQQNQQQQSNRATSKDLRIGDVFKLGVPCKVVSIETEKRTLHDALNRGQKVLRVGVRPEAGPWAGKVVDLTTTESDRIELVSQSMKGRTWGERVSMWWAKLYIPLLKTNKSSNNDKD